MKLAGERSILQHGAVTNAIDFSEKNQGSYDETKKHPFEIFQTDTFYEYHKILQLGKFFINNLRACLNTQKI